MVNLLTGKFLGLLPRLAGITLVFLAVQESPAAVVIDGFNTGGTTMTPAIGATGTRHPDIGLGGEREARCINDASNVSGITPNISCLMGAFFNGLAVNNIYEGSVALAIAEDGNVGSYHLLWDGVQNAPYNYNYLLGVQDLAQSGQNNVIRINYANNSDSVSSFEIRVYSGSDPANYAYLLQDSLLNTGQSSLLNYVNWDFLFSEFEEAGTGADFSAVTAVELLLEGSDKVVLAVNKLAAEAQVVGSISSELVEDRNGDGDIDSGSVEGENDIFVYTIELTNVEDFSAHTVTNLVYEADIITNATLVVGSVTTSQGTVTSGNDGGDNSVAINVGTLIDGEQMTITYQVKMDAGLNTTGMTYSHSGRVSSVSNGFIDSLLAPNTFTVNAFDVTVTMIAEPSPVSGDADADGFSGESEMVRFTATITNTDTVGRTLTFWQLPIENASLVNGSVAIVSGTAVIATGNASGDEYVRINRYQNSLPAGQSIVVRFDLIIDTPFPFSDFEDFASFIEAQAIVTERNNGTSTLEDAIAAVASSDYKEWSDDPDTGAENDASRMQVDAFPNNEYASVDTDQDGYPEVWNAGSCDEELPAEDINSCESLSGLEQDPAPNNPTNDLTPPVVTAPADIKVTASGKKTTVSIGQATAVDNLDGELTPAADMSGPFKVGKYFITWSATDAAGNVGTAVQKVVVVEPKEEEPIVEPSPSSGGGGSFTLLSLLSMLWLAVRRYRFEKRLV